MELSKQEIESLLIVAKIGTKHIKEEVSSQAHASYEMLINDIEKRGSCFIYHLGHELVANNFTLRVIAVVGIIIWIIIG